MVCSGSLSECDHDSRTTRHTEQLWCLWGIDAPPPRLGAEEPCRAFPKETRRPTSLPGSLSRSASRSLSDTESHRRLPHAPPVSEGVAPRVTGCRIRMPTPRLPFETAPAIVVPMACAIERRQLWATSHSSRNSAARSRRTPPRQGGQPRQSPSKTATATPSSPWRRARSRSPDGRCPRRGNSFVFSRIFSPSPVCVLVRCYAVHRQLGVIPAKCLLTTTSRREETKATATTHRKQSNTKEPPLLLAFELGLKTWKLGFARAFRNTPWIREVAGGD